MIFRFSMAPHFLAAWALGVAVAFAQSASLDEGAIIELPGGKGKITQLETLPFVQNEFTEVFKFDHFSNPKLKELRDRYKLHEVIASGADEFDQQRRLMEWTHERFQKFGTPSTNAKGALKILNAIDEGHTFFCSHYAHVFISAAASLGWVDRELALRRHKGVAKVGGSTEHATTEIWSNQHRKWVMLDPTSNMHLEKNGVPLNAWEIRQEWFYRDGTNLVFVVGKERKKYRKADLPVTLRSFEGFGELAIHPDELDKYGFIAYIPNNNFLDAGEDYGSMFITKDELCAGTQWHTRKAPRDPAVDPYFAVGQAALTLGLKNGNLHATLKTMTPNFKGFEARLNDGEWQQVSSDFPWNTRFGINRLEVRTRNQFGLAGPISKATIEVTALD